MNYFCISCGTQLTSVANKRPNFCQKCGEPQSSSVNKPKPKVQEVEEEDEPDEEEIEFPTNLKVEIAGIKGWESKVVKAGSVIGTTEKSGRNEFKRPTNDKYIETVQKKFKDSHSIEVAI